MKFPLKITKHRGASFLATIYRLEDAERTCIESWPYEPEVAGILDALNAFDHRTTHKEVVDAHLQS